MRLMWFQWDQNVQVLIINHLFFKSVFEYF